MPINKQALFRYRIIDECFNKGPKYEWTNDELLQQVNVKLHERSSKFLETKKLHSSQQRLYKEGEWTYFELFVKNNYEFEAELRRFGSALEVLEPLSLREKFKAEAAQLYELYF